MKSKKGDINWMMIMMIVAIIALAVVIIIYASKSKQGADAFSGCEDTTGGKCMAQPKCVEQEGRVIATSKCKTSGDVCCQTI